MTTLVTEVLELPKIESGPFPTCFTAYPPNALGIVTSSVAVDAVIVAPPFWTMYVHCPCTAPNAVWKAEARMRAEKIMFRIQLSKHRSPTFAMPTLHFAFS
jgi:hypothetical protein